MTDLYLRFGRLPVPVINDTDDYHFELGKGITLREGTDLTDRINGPVRSGMFLTRPGLWSDGISAGVINIHNPRLIDEEPDTGHKRTGKVVTVEENIRSKAVADVLSENYPVPVHKIGIRDVFGESDRLRSFLKYGLDGGNRG